MRLGGHVAMGRHLEKLARDSVRHLVQNVGARAGGPRVAIVVWHEPAVPPRERHHGDGLAAEILDRSKGVSAEVFPDFLLVTEERAVQNDRGAVGRHGFQPKIRDQPHEADRGRIPS